MDKDNILNISIIVLVVILIGVGFIALMDKFGAPDKYTYEGPNGVFTFTKIKQGADTYHNLELYASNKLVNERLGINDDRTIIIPFRYGPDEVKNIEVSNDSVAMIDHFNKMLNPERGLFLTYDPNEKAAIVISAAEIGRVIGTESYGVFQIPTDVAYSKPYAQNDTRIIKTCNQTDWIQGVIHFTLGDETKVFKHPAYTSCIIVEGKNYDDLTRATDALIYNGLGVINTTIPQDKVIGNGIRLNDYEF
jgi:hypothetical protein